VGIATADGKERVSDDVVGETEEMRNGNVYDRLNEANDKKVATLYRQIQFIQTRLQAYEIVTFEMGLIDVIKSLFSRKTLRTRVDQVQLRLIQEHDQAAKESLEKSKEEKTKPKLTIVGANGISKLTFILVVGALSSGCVSIKKHNKIVASMAHDNANATALLDNCKKVAKSQENEIKAKTARLHRLGQVDNAGNLRKWHPWEGDTDPNGWDGPDGSEPWLK